MLRSSSTEQIKPRKVREEPRFHMGLHFSIYSANQTQKGCRESRVHQKGSRSAQTRSSQNPTEQTVSGLVHPTEQVPYESTAVCTGRFCPDLEEVMSKIKVNQVLLYPDPLYCKRGPKTSSTSGGKPVQVEIWFYHYTSPGFQMRRVFCRGLFIWVQQPDLGSRVKSRVFR